MTLFEPPYSQIKLIYRQNDLEMSLFASLLVLEVYIGNPALLAEEQLAYHNR